MRRTILNKQSGHPTILERLNWSGIPIGYAKFHAMSIEISYLDYTWFLPKSCPIDDTKRELIGVKYDLAGRWLTLGVEV